MGGHEVSFSGATLNGGANPLEGWERDVEHRDTSALHDNSPDVLAKVNEWRGKIGM